MPNSRPPRDSRSRPPRTVRDGRSHATRPGTKARPRNGYEPFRRHRVIVALMLIAALAISGRLVWIQGLNSAQLAAEARANRLHTERVPALRGDILDSDGQVLATSTERYRIIVDQRQMPNYREKSQNAEVKGVKAVAMELSPLLSMSVDELEQKLTGKSGYTVLAKDVSPEVEAAVKQLKIGGVTSERVAERLYPAGQVAGNIVGFTGSDGTALAGAELSFDKILRGTDGERQYERGAGGQLIPSAKVHEKEAIDGESIELTIDRDLQYRAQEILAQRVKDFGGSGGSAVVIDPRTGHVLALADYPTYDPNDPGAADAQYRGNQSISNVFEPGSTGKLFTVASVINEGKAKVDDKFTIPYRKEFGGESIKDSHEHPVLHDTLAGVLKHSSNVGTVEVSRRISNEKREEYLRGFGFGARTNIGLPGESAGILHAAKDWRGRTQYAVAFGHGYAVTPLQVTSAVGTFGNDGVHIEPRIVKGRVSKDGSFTPEPKGDHTRVVSSETAATMRALMDNDVDDDGKAAGSVEGYPVGGKSGTAQVPGGTYTSSFISMAPMDDPQLVVGVFVYGVRGFKSGSIVAGPAVSELLGYALQRRGIAPSGTPGTQLENEWK
ncbi:penicillin-binding protein 2 [Dermabacter hominis]|uniref:peptidoglycan D,D-transpeptidase FtsI family protein n=1 Tax=Dermabacter hominis TaxID=36740 RepID=UPI00316ACAF8|nr:penicillin-binding protein 2 [Dermabacter hominis]